MSAILKTSMRWDTRIAPAQAKYAASMECSPRQNHLLAELPEDEYARLLPELVLVALPLGWSVRSAGSPSNYWYFIIEGIVSKQYVMLDGAEAEFAAVGKEGVVGVASILGGGSMPSKAQVVRAGHAYRLPARVGLAAFYGEGRLRSLILRHIMSLAVQIGQTAACNRHHAVEQQLATLLLQNMDRQHSSEIKITQELLASELGVRRESVTESARNLQAAGLISYCRGRISVLDRAKLEGQACECYEVVRQEHNRLLPPH